MALPVNWRTAESIRQLHRQLRPLAPNAPATSFGTVADAAHGTSSDHYPKVYASLGTRPVVLAGDFPNAEQLDSHAVLEAIRASRDARVKYGISRGRMFSSYATSSHPAWTWRPYSGSDGHFSHGHLSVVADARADDTTSWRIGVEDMSVFTDVHGLYLKLLYENWAPNKAEWVKAGGNPVTFDLLVANGSLRNGLALKLADLEKKLDQLLARPTLTDTQVQALGDRIDIATRETLTAALPALVAALQQATADPLTVEETASVVRTVLSGLTLRVEV